MHRAQATLDRIREILRDIATSAHDLDVALDAARVLGRINWQNNDGLLMEEALEAELHARHGASLALQQPLSPAPLVDWLHVISEAYEFGGHTRLLDMLIAAQRRRGATLAVAVTRSAPDSFLEKVKASGTAVYLLSGTPTARAARLLRLGQAAQRTVLHIHPDDIGAALSARQLQAEGRQVLFVNHADHVFSYGVGATNVCLEISGFGWRLSKAKRRVRAQHFLGIPVDAGIEHPTGTGAVVRAATVFSMGSSHKYRPGGGYDFPAFVSDLLDRTDATVEIVGPVNSDAWWASALARHPGRIRLLGPVPFAEAEARLSQATAYVDSFPINGGTAFPQALMAGKSVFGPGADAGGYNLADAMRSSSVAAMSEALIAFLSTGVAPARETEIRQRIAAEFNSDAIAERLDAGAEGHLSYPPDELLASPRRLDWYPGMWQTAAGVNVDLESATRMGVAARAKLAYYILGRAHIRQHPMGRRALLRWAATGRVG